MMEFAPILGMAMIVVGLIGLVVSLGVLFYSLWFRLAGGKGEGPTAATSVSDSQPGTGN